MTPPLPSKVFAEPSRRSTMREMAIGLLRAHPSKKTLPLKQQQATLDPNFRLRLLANFNA